MGRVGEGQPIVYQRGILDLAHGKSVAGFAARLGRLEKYTPPLLPLARQWDLGNVARGTDRGSGFRVADDRRQPRQGSPPCGGCGRRQPGHGTHKRGLNTKIHLAVDAHGMPVRVIITAGTTADCSEAGNLIEGIKANDLIADRGYDTNAILAQAESNGMTAVIPPKKNRTVQRSYDKDLYKLRHLVENAFLNLKQWRGIATRYAKNASSFLAAVQIRCISLWIPIS